MLSHVSKLIALAFVVGCGGRAAADADGRASTAEDVAAAAGDSGGGAASQDPEDPCRTVTQAEVERVVGPLRAAPWRGGATCYFAAADGQRVDIEVQHEGAQAFARITGAVDREMAKGLIVQTDRGLDTLEGRWDDAQWKLGSYLVARQGDRSVTVYMANTIHPNAADAAGLADVALSRMDAPLAYRGDAHEEPAPLVTPVDPCTLLTKAEVEAVAGPVTGAPVASDDRTCTWPLAPKKGRTRELSYTVTWKNGIEELNQDLTALGLYKTNLEDPELANARGGSDEDPLEPMKKDPAAKKAMGALKGLLGGDGDAGDPTSLMPKSDPNVPGPWQRAALLAGSDFVVVQKGVRIRAGISAAGYEATRQLMEKAVARLQ